MLIQQFKCGSVVLLANNSFGYIPRDLDQALGNFSTVDEAVDALYAYEENVVGLTQDFFADLDLDLA